MIKIVYYLLLKPISLLPLSWLYLLSDIVFFMSYRVVKYRREVVWTNVRNSFPDKTEKEIKIIVHDFYKHFGDLAIESIKSFSISKKEAIQRCKVLNPEVLDKYYDEGRPVVLVGGHQNNWELLALIMNAQVKHLIVGIYSPLSNSFFDKKFRESRSRFGTMLVPKKETKNYFEAHRADLNATVFGADQSPALIKENTYWTTFLSQETPVMFGTEKYAIENNCPVIYFTLTKIKRGHYQAFFKLLEESPSEAEYCSITEKHTRFLETDVINNPAYYLWTHKRWKHKRKN